MIFFDKIPPNLDQQYVLRPVPFISISSTPLRAGTITLGNDYTITLTGTILPHRGSPFTNTVNSGQQIAPSPIPTDVNSNFSKALSVNPEDIGVFSDSRGAAIILKQNAIREIFAYDGIEMHIWSWDGQPIIRAPVSLESLIFDQGNYVNTATYTATFKAPYLINENNGSLVKDSTIELVKESIGPSGTPSPYWNNNTGQTVENMYDKYGGFVNDYNESWSIETDDQKGTTSDTNPFEYNPRTYIITRDTTATGKVTYRTDQKLKIEAWENAKNFIYKHLNGSHGNNKQLLAPFDKDIDSRQYPYYKATASEPADEEQPGNRYAHLMLDLIGYSGGYDHYRTESINKSTGTVSVSDRWVLLKGSPAYENYDMSISSNNNNAFVNFTINGSIKGVSSRNSRDKFFGGDETPPTGIPSDLAANPDNSKIADENAMKKYNIISNHGKFDINSFVYKRVAALTNLSVNPQPLSISVSRNPFSAEITYSLEYDNRPLNIVSEALSEVISIQDTYPGDLYAIIPVIGRPSGPVLQYIGGRTEYSRSVNIELLFDYTDIDRYTPAKLTKEKKDQELINTRKSLLLSKPSLINNARDQINNLVRSVSPLNEPGIRKCFVNPPRETWNPREGRYSLSIDWVYELDPEIQPSGTSDSKNN